MIANKVEYYFVTLCALAVEILGEVTKFSTNLSNQLSDLLFLISKISSLNVNPLLDICL